VSLYSTSSNRALQQLKYCSTTYSVLLRVHYSITVLECYRSTRLLHSSTGKSQMTTLLPISDVTNVQLAVWHTENKHPWSYAVPTCTTSDFRTFFVPLLLAPRTIIYAFTPGKSLWTPQDWTQASYQPFHFVLEYPKMAWLEPLKGWIMVFIQFHECNVESYWDVVLVLYYQVHHVPWKSIAKHFEWRTSPIGFCLHTSHLIHCCAYHKYSWI